MASGQRGFECPASDGSPTRGEGENLSLPYLAIESFDTAGVPVRTRNGSGADGPQFAAIPVFGCPTCALCLVTWVTTVQSPRTIDVLFLRINARTSFGSREAKSSWFPPWRTTRPYTGAGWSVLNAAHGGPRASTRRVRPEHGSQSPTIRPEYENEGSAPRGAGVGTPRRLTLVTRRKT